MGHSCFSLSFPCVSSSTSCRQAWRRAQVPGFISQTHASAQQDWADGLPAANTELSTEGRSGPGGCKPGSLVSALLPKETHPLERKTRRMGILTPGNADPQICFLLSSFHRCPLRKNGPELPTGPEEDRYNQLQPLPQVLPGIFKKQLFTPEDFCLEEQCGGARMPAWGGHATELARTLTGRHVTTQRTQ